MVLTFVLLLPSSGQGYSPPVVSAPHAPILIEGDGGFIPANGVTGGSGTNASPFILSGWSIQVNSGAGIEVRNTTAAFVIRDVEVNGTSPGSGNTLGILLKNATDGSIERARVFNTSVGLHVEAPSRLTVSNSTFHPDDTFYPSIGVFIWGSPTSARDVIVADSTFQSGFTSLEAQNVSRLTVVRSTFWVPRGQAILLWGSDNVTLRGNHFLVDYLGVALVGSYRIQLEDNRIEGGTQQPPLAGIQVDATDDVVLIRNEIRDVSSAGILFQMDARFPGRRNTPFLAYHNNFVGGAAIIQSTPLDSVWDNGYPSGGNYWSDYGGTDACRGPAQDDCSNRDGFGDLARAWYTEGVFRVADRYPLIRSYPLPTVPPVARVTVETAGGDVSTRFVFNASRSSDARDPSSLLEFRWDWEGDGSWDTSWSSDPVEGHVFPTAGEHSVHLESRNTAGLTNATSTSVHVSPPSLGQMLVGIWPIFPIAVALIGVVLFLRYRKRRVGLLREKPPEQRPPSAP